MPNCNPSVVIARLLPLPPVLPPVAGLVHILPRTLHRQQLLDTTQEMLSQ